LEGPWWGSSGANKNLKILTNNHKRNMKIMRVSSENTVDRENNLIAREIAGGDSIHGSNVEGKEKKILRYHYYYYFASSKNANRRPQYQKILPIGGTPAIHTAQMRRFRSIEVN
jgi:hypothetical protein